MQSKLHSGLIFPAFVPPLRVCCGENIKEVIYMKKQILSLALALALCVGLSVPALAYAAGEYVGDGTGADSFNESIGQPSLDQPAPLPEHLAARGDSDSWLLYDFDRSKLLEITRDEWDNRVYTVLEGMEFTVYQNPSWKGMMSAMPIYTEDESEIGYFYRAGGADPLTLEEMRYMPPTTVTFDHNVTLPDGTVADLANLGETYDLRFEVWTSYEYFMDEGEYVEGEDPGMSWTSFGEKFRVIPAVAYASTQTVDIDGEAKEFQMYAIKDANGNDTNYVKVRDVALALDGSAAQFNVGWDGNVNLETGKAYTTRNGYENNTPYSGNQPFTCATSTTNVDGEAASLTAFVITDANGNGSTYYKLRDLGAALGFTVDWSAERGIYIETK